MYASFTLINITLYFGKEHLKCSLTISLLEMKQDRTGYVGIELITTKK